MKKLIQTIGVFSLFTCANADVGMDKSILKKNLTASMPLLKIEKKNISPTQIKGLYELIVGANIYYVSIDGKYLIQGHLFDLMKKKDLTEEKLIVAKASMINAVPLEEMIIFKSPVQKYVINIFTDIDCGYCRKLHAEIDQYMAEGITIRYLFFPRAGKDSESYEKAVSVWCADDKNTALTIAKSNKAPLTKKTCKNPLDKQMALGNELGVRGTPMMISPKGYVYPGYMSAKKLAVALSQEK